MKTQLSIIQPPTQEKQHTEHLILGLLERINKSNQSPCFILAPRLCGQEELLRAWYTLDTLSSSVSVLEVDTDGVCHEVQAKSSLGLTEELSESYLPEDASVSESGRLVLLSYVPWLEDEAAQRFSAEINTHVQQGARVVVLCPVQHDRYQNLQGNRLEITARELKEAGLFSASSYTESLRQFTREFLPLHVRLAAVLVALLGHSSLDELSSLGYRLSPDLPALLERLHPLFTATESGRSIRSEPVDMLSMEPEVFQVMAEYLEEEGQQVNTTLLAARVTVLSIRLLERGELEASHQILELSESLISKDPLVSHAYATQRKTGVADGGAGSEENRAPAALHSSRIALPLSSYVAKTAPPLSLRLFGKLEVSLEGVPLKNKQLSRTKIRRLLAFLALSQNRTVSRDTLITYLWPHLDFVRAQKNLYTSWCMLARGLGSESVRDCPYIIRDGEIYQLSPEHVLCDTEQFEALARSVLFAQPGASDQTRELFELEVLYRDTLVADIPTDAFISNKMVGYRSMMVDTLLLVTRQLRAAGELEKALFCARSAYELDETREDVYRDLMDTQFEAGQRTSAMQTYFSCKRYLADELGILPSKRTTALYQDLLLDNCR